MCLARALRQSSLVLRAGVPACLACIAWLACFACLACFAIWPLRAEAWTRTAVESLRGHAEVDAAGRARITLEVGVHVQGGWLSQFELTGLGTGAALDRWKPAVLYGDPDVKHAALAELSPEGDLTLDFGDKRRAPWRGHYVIRVHYEATLARRGEHNHAVLTLPAFAAPLDDVELWIEAPKGTRLGAASELATESHQAIERGPLSLFRVHRPQLPRTRALEVELMLPVRAKPAREATKPAPLSFDPRALVLGLLLTATAGLQRLRAARRGLSFVHLVPVRSHVVRVSLALGLCVAATITREPSASLCLALWILAALLLLPRSLCRSALGAASPQRVAAASIDLQRAQWARRLRLLGPASLLDATTPLGVLWLLLCLAAALLASDSIWLEGLCVLSSLWIGVTRLHEPPGAHDAVWALEAQRRPLARVAGERARLTLTVRRAGPAGEARDPELSVRCAPAPEGLEELGLVVARSSDARSTLAWRARVSEGTPAADVLASAWPYARAMQDGTLLVPSHQPAEDLERLLGWLASVSPRDERGLRAPARAA